jgi:ATP-dependent helicase/nuclease subunit A
VSAADAAARRRAQTEFDAPLLLEAGAGTGKTAVLVARIVAWCLGPGWERAAGPGSARASGPSSARAAGPGEAPADPRHAARVLRGVVAITFTDAATAEMASRIADAFEKIGRGELPPGVLEQALPAPAVRAARAAAFRLALDQLRVHTIHAFCLRLLLAHPLEAGVHPRLAVDADGQRVAASVREGVEEALPRAFGAEGDARWIELAQAGIGPRDLEAALAALLGEGVAPEDLADGGATALRSARFVEMLRDALTAFTALEGGRLAALRGAPKVAASAGALAAAREVAETASDLAALQGALLALPGWEGVADLLASCAGRKLGARASEAIGGDAEALAERAAALRPLLAHLDELDLARFATARSVLADLAAGVHQRLRQRGVATFGALLRGARDLLRDPAVRRSVRGEIQQLLVDEFQDTDALQCEILRALALDDPAAPRPVLFLVGDPKQSIYGWRNADLRAYQQLRDALAASGGIATLVVNFRSAPAILGEVRRVVEPVMEPVHGLQPPFEALEPSERTRGLAGYTAGGRAPVEHWLPARVDPASGALDEGGGRERLAEREARAAARDIAALRAQGVRLDQVAVLLRVTAAFEPVLEALREAGLPYVVERETDFYQRREIVDAVALVRCVLDPHDHLALVAALRSSVAGVPDAAWLPLWREHFPQRAGAIDGADAGRLAAAREAARAAAAKLPPDVPEARELAGWPEALDDFLCALHELRGAYERETPERFVERLRERVLLEASEASRHLGEHRAANLDRFFRDLVLALEEAAGSAASLVAFLRRAGSVAREHNEGRPRAAAGDAVHVLTIHRAKGLDWEHVYLLGCDRGQRGEDPKRTAVVRRAGDLGFVLFGWPEPGLPVLAAERADVESAERVRLLYVATTRAKLRLVIGARRANGKEWRRAKSFAELLPARRGAQPAWEHAAAAEEGVRSEDGVLFRVVDAPDPEGRAAPPPGPALPGAEQVASDEARLRVLREQAAAHAKRPFSAAASAEAHGRDERAGGESDEPESPRPKAPPEYAGEPVERGVALAAGTAVHALLEAGRLDAAAADGPLERAVAMAALPGEREAVLAHARTVWRRFAAGPLAPRLAALAPHVVARELPVWLAPREEDAEGPVGFVAGAIDLLYRDPASGELVVADYKTDAVDGADLGAHALRYAAQGEHYVRAVQQALALAARPRFELWFLAAGEVRVLG